MTRYGAISLVVMVLLQCHNVYSQILSDPRNQPSRLQFPHTSLCCDSTGQKLMSCLLNASNTVAVFDQKQVAVMYTYVTPNIQSYAASACAVNSMYAEGNGYKFEILMQDETNSYEPLDPRWNKVKILIDAMDNIANADVQYFVWIDADMIVLDMGIRIEDIGLQYPDADILMSQDVIQNKEDKKADVPKGLANSGYIWVRHTPWARQVLYQWWSDYERHHMSDQSAFLLMYNDMKSSSDRAKLQILRPDALNTMFPAWLNQQPSNQFLHLAGESDIYREEVFSSALESLCSFSATNNDDINLTEVSTDGKGDGDIKNESILPRQLGLTREKLFQEWSILDSRRVVKLNTWKEDFIGLQEEFNRRSKKKKYRVINEYEEYVESTCNGIHNILKNSANEENEKRHRSGRHSDLDQVTIELKKLCFESFSNIANAREDIFLASVAGGENMKKDKGKQDFENDTDDAMMVAEKFRAAMSSGYDLINFASEVQAYQSSPTDEKNKNTQIFSEAEIFDMLDLIGEELLPKLKSHLPSKLVHRGMYYEFKYYEFLSIALAEHNRGDDIMDAMANAINLWRTLHKEYRYYGTDYDAIDRMREGWTIISKYGLMACSEATGSLTQLGVDSLKDSIKLLESTFKDLEGNPLATPPLTDSVAFDLSIAHANCGLCTKQLNMKLASDNGSESESERDKRLILSNLKKSKQHLEKSLRYLQYIDQSSGSSNRDHEGYVSSQVDAVGKDILQLERRLKKEKEREKQNQDEGKDKDSDSYEEKEEGNLSKRKDKDKDKNKKPPVTKKKLMRKKKKKKV